MKLLFDFLPIVAFFIAYKFYGIYIATGAAIGISLLQVLYAWIRYRQVATLQLISMVIIVILGGATLLLHDEMLIKWKPTALYWLLAIAFLASQWFSNKPIIQRLMESNVSLQQRVWNILNLSWAVFFATMGAVNLYVVYNFSTDTWVNFKLFGILGITFAFIIGQAIYLSTHLKEIEDPKT